MQEEEQKYKVYQEIAYGLGNNAFVMKIIVI